MEVMLRIELPDVPGSLSQVANVIGTLGGDIQAVEVQSSEDGVAIDDVWVTIDRPETIAVAFDQVGDIKILHMGPSRGLPVVSTLRVCSVISNVLTGVTSFEQGVNALLRGNLSADLVQVVPKGTHDGRRDRRQICIPLTRDELIISREYRFLNEEVTLANELVRMCRLAASKHKLLQAAPAYPTPETM